MKNSKTLWGGRFTEKTDEKFFRFNCSFDLDSQLFAADVRGCLAHCRGLESAGVLTADESLDIQEGLLQLLQESKENGSFFADAGAEDVHSFIENKLTDAIGSTGRKLHTGRSRNDQTATALRIWMRGAIDKVLEVLQHMQECLLDLAQENQGAVLPGYSHLQRAQPISFAHWCLAYFEMLRRDTQRFAQARRNANILPLGSAALAGTSFPIDRIAVAADLGFAEVSRNSLDAVSDRDFCVDFVYAASLTMTHLSRLAEDIVLYSTREFGFVELSEKVSTGSSIMPQKKNPDSMELVRGKSARVYGSLVSLLTMLKGLPLSYNKDMQEDKQAVFDAFRTVRDSLEISAIVIKNLNVNEERMREAASTGFLNATELADYLVRRGLSFRQAHEAVGKIVLEAIGSGSELAELSLDAMHRHAPEIDRDVYEALTLERAIDSKNTIGGTSPERVAEALREARDHLKNGPQPN